jgi:hypothetical protein
MYAGRWLLANRGCESLDVFVEVDTGYE